MGIIINHDKHPYDMPNPQGDDAVRWCAAPRDGSLAWRLREDGGDVVRTTSLKDPKKKHQKNPSIFVC